VLVTSVGRKAEEPEGWVEPSDACMAQTVEVIDYLLLA